MELTVTRHDLSSALIRLLEAKGVADPASALEVLGSPTYGLDVLVLIPAERARLALGETLVRVTGNPHPTTGNLWILDQGQSLALIKMGEDLS
jgi:hypothetical protein